MSKPQSGLFKNTTGYSHGKVFMNHNLDLNDIAHMSDSGDNFDRREHPIPYKELSSKKLGQFREKELRRTLTKDEYKHKEWNRRFNNRKARGINAFWRKERQRILHGLPTIRNWSASQIRDILDKKRPRYKNQAMQSHHTYSAAKFPHLADKGNLIYPATPYEHRHSWHGGNYKQSLPGRPFYNDKEF